jgi:hypothetical protein
MKQIVPLVSLVLLTVFLAACLPEEVIIREREQNDHAICMRRGGDYDKCRASVVEERKACLKQWYAMPPEERRRFVLQPETRTPEIRACNALGV